jgi:hypothetical protein
MLPDILMRFTKKICILSIPISMEDSPNLEIFFLGMITSELQSGLHPKAPDLK